MKGFSKWVMVYTMGLSAFIPVWADLAIPTPWPTLKEWKSTLVPWDAWFKDNTMVSDKGAYIHFFLNAQDFKSNFEVKDKKGRLAETALELVKRLSPKDAKADLMKVDIVFVLERDSYGAPNWDSLKRVAHLEFLRSKVPLKPLPGGMTEAAMKRIFDKFETY